MNGDTTRILLIEDNAGDAFLVQEVLTEAPADFHLTHKERLDDGLEYLKRGDTDVALVDLSLQDTSGLNTVIKLCAAAPELPVLVLTGLDDEDTAVRAVKNGAQDYLLKGELSGPGIVRAMRYAIQRKRMALELEGTRQQQLQLKDHFLSHVSHELRSPLTAIHQFVTIVLDGIAGKLNSEQREYLHIALRNVNQLRTMIGDLLEATRAQTAKHTLDPTCVSLISLIPETIGMMTANAFARNITVSSELGGYLPPAHADQNRVRQILINLIDNAIKFTPEGGNITVHAEVFAEDSRFLCVAVEDTGCGISPEATRLVFERHYQEGRIETSRNGLGLGLYLCKELVARHGGEIWIESKLGAGTTVYFTLPVFYLSTLLFPILSAQQETTESITLVPIEVFPLVTASGADARRVVLQHAWDLLRQSLTPEREVLLPRMATMGAGEIFIVVSRAEKDGEEEAAMIKRIQELGEACQDFQGATIDLRVLATIAEGPRGPNKSIDEFAINIAHGIEDVLKMAV